MKSAKVSCSMSTGVLLMRFLPVRDFDSGRGSLTVPAPVRAGRWTAKVRARHPAAWPARSSRRLSGGDSTNWELELLGSRFRRYGGEEMGVLAILLLSFLG